VPVPPVVVPKRWSVCCLMTPDGMATKEEEAMVVCRLGHGHGRGIVAREVDLAMFDATLDLALALYQSAVAALVVKEKDSARSRSPVVSFVVAEAVLHIAAAVVTKAKAKAMNLVTEFALAVLVTVDPVVVLVLLVLVAFAYLWKEGQHDYFCTDMDIILWECPFPIGKLQVSQQQESKRTSKQHAEGNSTCKILHKVHRLKPYNITLLVSSTSKYCSIYTLHSQSLLRSLQREQRTPSAVCQSC
jgi:hypothetical protein